MQEPPFEDFQIFDGATRGPLGAFLTISVLAVDPVVHQIIAYESKAFAVATSTVPTAVLYESWGSGS